MADFVYDPYDAALHLDPHPVWKRMRDETPLHYNDVHNFYALSRFEDVRAAELDAATFSSAHGVMLDLLDLPIEMVPKTLPFLDPPEHRTRLRTLVNRTFTPRRVAELESRVRELCAEYLDPFVGTSGFDVVGDFSAKLPMMVIGSLLGIPLEDQDQVREWADRIFDRKPGADFEYDFEVMVLFHEYFVKLAETRRREPAEDIMTALAFAEIEADDGTVGPLSDDQLGGFLMALAAAGAETVTRMVGWAGWLLGRHPGELAKLAQDPSLIGGAVEEILRFESPAAVVARWVTRDIELHGRVVPADSKMLLLLGSAGRDEREFADANRFDVTRRPASSHLAFGHGIHHCLGAALARLEGRVAIEELLNRFPTWEADEGGLEIAFTSTARGPSSVPITLI